MMNADLQQLIQLIHDSPTRAVIVTAGAGSQALADLLVIGGASRTLIEGLIPYGAAAFDDFLGQHPDQYVALPTARLLAGRACSRAYWLEPETSALVGLACTAAIASDRPKRGEHRAHIATWQLDRLVEYNLQLTKGLRERSAEEAVVSCVMINALAAACNLPQTLPLELQAEDKLTVKTYDFAALAKQVTAGQMNFFGLYTHGAIREPNDPPRVVLSGAFNPLHDGHLGMARAAEKILGLPVVFELAAINVDKPPLPAETILGRIAQFAGRHAVLVSNAPTYIQKARLYPGATFVVGFDTAVRIFDPRYYQNSVEQMHTALDEIRTLGCTFLVAGRVDNQAVFRSLADVAVPATYADLFQAIPTELFRYDISSTQLRTIGARGSR